MGLVPVVLDGFDTVPTLGVPFVATEFKPACTKQSPVPSGARSR
jgi:hypothetical protein